MNKIEKIIADYSWDGDNNITNKFGRTMSEMLHLMEYHYGVTEMDDLTLENLFEEEMTDITDDDGFYAGPETVEFMFECLPNEFIVENNIDGEPESFLVTKTGTNTFSAKLID